jgi:hypothetical protein
MVSGYSLIKTGSMADAVEMATGCPAKLTGATISIFERSSLAAQASCPPIPFAVPGGGVLS